MGKLNVTDFTNAEQHTPIVVKEEEEKSEFHFEREQDFIQVFSESITEEGCDEIIEIHHNTPFEEVEHDEETNKYMGPEDKVSRNLPYKYAHESNVDYTVIPLESKEFTKILDIMGHCIPNHVDFEVVQYVQIAHYKDDSFFPYHKDVGDMNDTGTLIMTLNNNYKGARVSVDRNTFDLDEGSILAFNNSTERWHGVEPIFQGERYVLLMWFTFNDNPHPTNDELMGEDV